MRSQKGLSAMSAQYLPPSDELLMFGEAIERWTQDRLSPAVLRKYRDRDHCRGQDAQLWTEMVELGLPGILIPEALGGSGAGFEAFGKAIESVGRSLAPTPLVSSCLVATAAILTGGTATQQANWLPQLASGTITATLAHEEDARHKAAAALILVDSDGSVTLNGTKIAVPEGLTSDLFVVSGRYGTGALEGHPALVLVPADHPGVTRQQRVQVDSREYADVTFDNVTVSSENVLSGRITGDELLDYVLDCMRIGLSLEMIGGAEQAFAITLEYLKTRVQFGQVIGSFQALQHRAAEVYSRLAIARYCVRAAMQALDQDREDTALLASLAKATAGETFNFVASEMIQLHGGIGMTDELDAGFYLKRSRVADALAGNQAFHRERYARIRGW